jgi:hypothetical protein
MYYTLLPGVVFLSTCIYVYRNSIMTKISQAKTLYDLVSNVESTSDLGEFRKLDESTGYVMYNYNGDTRYIFFQFDVDEFTGMGQDVTAVKDGISYNITPPAGSRLGTTPKNLNVDSIIVDSLEYYGDNTVDFPTETDFEF